MISNGEAVAIENGTNISNIVLTIPQLGIDSLNPHGLIWGAGNRRWIFSIWFCQ